MHRACHGFMRSCAVSAILRQSGRRGNAAPVAIRRRFHPRSARSPRGPGSTRSFEPAILRRPAPGARQKARSDERRSAGRHPSTEEAAMIREFKQFLLQTNALALAVGVIIGGAVGKVVSSIVSDLLMPLIGLLIPGG